MPAPEPLPGAAPRAFHFNLPAHVRLDGRRAVARSHLVSHRRARASAGVAGRAPFEPQEAPTTKLPLVPPRLGPHDGAACCQKTTALHEGSQDGLDGHDRFTEAHKAPPLDERDACPPARTQHAKARKRRRTSHPRAVFPMAVAALRRRRKPCRRDAQARRSDVSAAHFKSPSSCFMFVRRQFVWIITVLARTVE